MSHDANEAPSEATPLQRETQQYQTVLHGVSSHNNAIPPSSSVTVNEIGISSSNSSSNTSASSVLPSGAASSEREPIVSPANGRKTGRTNGKMDDTKKVLLKVGFDFLILCCVGFPILIFFVAGDPFKRGFFCDDESLMHPFHDSTVTNWMLYIIGLALPIIVILLTEVIRGRRKTSEAHPLKVWNYNIPFWVVQAYKSIGMFGFGAAVSQLLTDVGKYTIGRLRPHFFDVCQPKMRDGTFCNATINQGKYITDFECTSMKSSTRMLKEMRLSFPSGHSSFSMYTLVFCAIFLQARMNWRGSKLLKHFLQFLLILLAWYTCLSRISDYKHHWSDVLSGAVLGATVAIVVSNFCTDLFSMARKRAQGPMSSSLPQTRYELSANHANGN